MYVVGWKIKAGSFKCACLSYLTSKRHLSWKLFPEMASAWTKIFPLFLADQILYRSYVSRQHFCLRSFASSCLNCRAYNEIVTNYTLLVKKHQVNTTSLGRTFNSASIKTGQRSCLSHSYMRKSTCPTDLDLTYPSPPGGRVGGG